MVEQRQHEKTVVLLLGGSGFMGLTLLKQLATKADRYHVVMVNRGKRYWDDESAKVVQQSVSVSHCKADRRSATFSKEVSAHILAQGLQLSHVIDFSCFKPVDCLSVLQVIDRVKQASRQVQRLKYLFISSDSTYDASGFLLDSHSHDFLPSAFQNAEQASKPSLPMHDLRLMYKNAYSEMPSGIVEECAYSESKLNCTNPDFSSQVTPEMSLAMGRFLKKLDSYGYKKILCEELFTEHADLNRGQIEFLSLRLPDVIGPFDESCRMWKYVTWMKTLLGLPSRLSAEQRIILKPKLPFEAPRDTERKLSFTYSHDVVNVIVDFMESESKAAQPFTPLNIACSEQVTMVDFLTLLESEIRGKAGLETTEVSTLIEPLATDQASCSSSDSGSSAESWRGKANQAYPFYPSVSCGPISVKAATESVLGFQPTPLREAVRSCVDFFFDCDEQGSVYEREANEMVAELMAEFN